jgi:hypothetical protein
MLDDGLIDRKGRAVEVVVLRSHLCILPLTLLLILFRGVWFAVNKLGVERKEKCEIDIVR